MPMQIPTIAMVPLARLPSLFSHQPLASHLVDEVNEPRSGVHLRNRPLPIRPGVHPGGERNRDVEIAQEDHNGSELPNPSGSTAATEKTSTATSDCATTYSPRARAI